MDDERGDYLQIRKLRKKLRQIEYLERLARSLNDEESLKVSKKQEFREELKLLLSRLPEEKKNQDVITEAVIVSPDDSEDDDSKSESDTSDNISIPDPTETQDSLIVMDQLVKEEGNNETSSIKRTHEERNESARASPIQATPKKLKTNENKSTKASESKNLKRIWRASEFTVQELVGHNDIITAVAADGNIIVTSSRDTTVKVWNPDKSNEQEVYSLRGHKGAVTCLVLLSKSHSDELCRYLGLVGSHRLALSGATDCSIILWSVTTGELKKSIYTFNTVTCIAYMQPEVCYITATDGGKLQIFDAVSGTLIRSLTAYDEGYTCMKTVDNFLFTASLEGIIQVWEMVDRNLTQKFSMDDLKLPEGSEVILRTVRCMEINDDWVYYGDDGPNIKVFNWKTREIRKFSNHICNWGSTDALVCNGQEILSSSYNLDESKGHLNVRLFPSGEYVCSLDDGESDRICCLAITATGFGNLRIVTGGSVLKVWDIYQPPFAGRKNQHKTKSLLKPTYTTFYEKDAKDSDYESSDAESSDSQSEEVRRGRYIKTYIPNEITGQSSIWTYCSIL